MANISLRGPSGTAVTYSGVETVTLPLAGGGTATFSASAGGGYTITVNCPTGSTVSASKSGSTYNGSEASTGVYTISVPETGTYTISATKSGVTKTTTLDVTGDSATLYPVSVGTLEATSWADISTISQGGYAACCWEVGDTKSVALSGTCGTLSLNTTLYVYILGFDHNAELEGKGITFGGFKTTATNGVDVCLVDANYNSSKTDGTKLFNMNHWGNYNHGGWAASDLRYDILGSTNTAPKGYGAARSTTNNVGYNPSSTCATSPVSNTLMSCLPSALRNVMKPITKYTDNIGNASNHNSSAITSTVDYLPLLSIGEVLGYYYYENRYAANKQKQYEYYHSGNATVKYRHSSTGSAAFWWSRSPYYSGSYYFCIVYATGNANNNSANISYGVAPAFLV